MKSTLSSFIEKCRIKQGPMGSSADAGPNGCFKLPVAAHRELFIIASNGMEWEHVSVSVIDQARCPTWDEMCQVKALFWDPEEVVIQFHPAASEYVNNHEFVLHLWRPIGVDLPTPPSILVGIQSLGKLDAPRPSRPRHLPRDLK